ncbi:helix-turn-helix domain-containing protein [Mucilaginibacter pedocola]|uniref:HTH cro/C1-type domain-containing protein n=1 Tax=Mucilaginibacter pedocola TaxID=1792845 RepID=A0A1S9PIN3_9SPHI|nr:helix-turn-helix domain-containing protein [Mucilaginibacter pedocola]OOQ60789.1 hypothetical protein BC343_22700 [Mucilaginibacter pedocola]
MKNNIAKNIKELRILKGLSQEKLAELAKISLRTVQRIENSETEARGHSLQQIAAALETTPEQLAGTTEKHITPQPVPEGKTYLATLDLSALSFIIFPLLGLVIPFILWMIKRGQIPNIDRVAKRALLIQSVWCLFVGYLYSVLLTGSPFFSIGQLGKAETLLVTAVVLYFGNIVLILINTFRSGRNKEINYPAALTV